MFPTKRSVICSDRLANSKLFVNLFSVGAVQQLLRHAFRYPATHKEDSSRSLSDYSNFFSDRGKLEKITGGIYLIFRG